MKTYKLFLASSSELKEDRKEFEIFFGREKDNFLDKKIRLELVIWENFLDAISETRLQGEYNKAILECHIFLLLFHTKLGDYTHEEFDTAYSNFKKNGRPYIYAYFKDADVSISNLNRKDINNVFDFQEKLGQIGHFYTRYKNIDNLKLQFKVQLEKLLKEGFFGIIDGNGAKKIPPQLTSIPRINLTDVIGRDKELEDIHNLLFSNNQLVLVNGLGGIGKTTLAQAYLGKYSNEYHHLAWLTQEKGQEISDSFLQNSDLLSNMQIDITKIEPEHRFQHILNALRKLENTKPNLLIIDNADNKLSAQSNLLPGHPHWHILVTSREEIKKFHLYELNFLTLESAFELFKKHYKKISDDEINKITKLIDYHTLTISTLAQSANENDWDYEFIKTALSKDRDTHIEGIGRIKSFLVSIFDMSNLSEDEKQIMIHFALMPSDFISSEDLKLLLQVDELEWKEEFAHKLKKLVRTGWLLKDKTGDNYKMHIIISEVTLEQLKSVFEDVRPYAESVGELLNLDESQDNPIDNFKWIPYGDSILRIFPNEKSTQISVLQNNLALVYEDLGDYEKARDYLEKALSSDLENFGEKHPNVALRQNNLASVYQALGDYAKARDLFEKALSSDLENFGEKHPNVAISQSNLAIVYQALGNYEKAHGLFEKALSSVLENFGEKHPNVAISQGNLASVYQALGNYEKAHDLFEKALSSDLENFGEKHPKVATSQNNLALVYRDLGDYEKARDLFEKALSSVLENFGEKHPKVATSQNNLALVYRDLGDYEKARDLFEKALSSVLENFEEKHPDVAISQSNLATVYQYLGDYEKARNYLEKALNSNLENFGEKHPNVSTLQSNLGLVYRDLGDYEKARDYLEKSLSSALENFGEKHPNVAMCQGNLGIVYGDLGDYEKARDYLEKALRSDLENFGEKHPNVAIRQSNLALVYQDLGDYEKARDYLEKALSSDLENFGKKHPNVARSQSNLGLVYRDLGDYEKARDYLEKALSSDLKNFGEKHPNVARSQSNLALVYKALGDYERARDYLEKALSSDLKNFGEKHPNVARSQSNLALVYKDLGDYEKARDFLEKALSSNLENFGEKHRNVAISQSNLASVLVELGEIEKAFELWKSAYSIYFNAFGPDHPNTKTVKEWLEKYKGLSNPEGET